MAKHRKKNWVFNSQNKYISPPPHLQMSVHLCSDSLIMVWIYRNPHSRVAQRTFQFPSRITDRSLLAHSNVFCKGKEEQCVSYQRFLRWQCRVVLDQWEHTVPFLLQEQSSALTTGKLTYLDWSVKPFLEKECQCISIKLSGVAKVKYH